MLFSRRKLEAAVVDARAEARRQLELQAELKASGSCAGMPSLIKTSIIGYQLLWILGGLLLVAEGSAHLVHAPPPVVSLLDTKLALQGVLLGVPGALLVSRLERWRSEAALAPSVRSSAIAPTLNFVFLPVSLFFPLFAESALSVLEEKPAMTAAVLVGGALVGSAWTHGLLQVAWGAFLHDAAQQLAATPTLDVGREGLKWVEDSPLVALSQFASAAAPLAAAAAAAAQLVENAVYPV